jgi:predicted secreted hydrolase
MRPWDFALDVTAPRQHLQRRRLLRTALLLPLSALPAISDAASNAATRPSRTLAFPQDFGAHPEARIEWWYATGWLVPADAAGDAEPGFGFQVTFFRSRTDVPADYPSAFAARQLVFAHAALSDLAARRLRHGERIARAGFGVAEAAVGDTRLKLRDWTLQRGGPAQRSVYRTRVASESASFALELQLAATQPVLLQGDDGWSRKGPAPAQASWYYSQPQLDVTGTLELDGRSLAARGRAWFDHEWSDSLLDAQAVGWDWIGINLDDGGALTAFRVRRADGSALWAGGSFRAPAGAPRSFAPDEVTFTPGRRWTSAVTRASYPVQWTVATPAGTFGVRPRFDAQELDGRGSTGTIYWEGLCDLLDAGGHRVGRGYLEMTGYAGRLQL